MKVNHSLFAWNIYINILSQSWNASVLMFYTNGIALFRWFYRGLKKKSTKNFRLMFGCLVLMEPVNHSYAVPSFSFRDSNREEKLSGTLSLVYHWPFLRFKTRQKPSAKKKGQKQNKTDCSHKIRWWFSHCHAVQTSRLQFKGKRFADENVQFLMKFMNNLLNFQINLDHTSYLSHALHVVPVWNFL